MDRSLTFAGTNLGTFEAHFSNGGSFPVPSRVYDRVSVLGRNGDLLIDNGKYSNTKITFPAYIFEDYRDNYNDLIAFLSSKIGYQRLEDSLEPDFYRMACYVGETDPSVKNSDTMGNFELTFDCKPQKFLKQDENGISVGLYADRKTITNPTKFVAKPLLKIYSGSTLRIGNANSSSIFVLVLDTLPSPFEYAFVDCETLEVYSSIGSNLSQYLDFNAYTSGNEKFPYLIGEGHWDVYSENSSSNIIYPRWWTV